MTARDRGEQHARARRLAGIVAVLCQQSLGLGGNLHGELLRGRGYDDAQAVVRCDASEQRQQECERLAAACLPVHQDRSVVAIQEIGDELSSRRLEHDALCCLPWQRVVEAELCVCGGGFEG